LGEEEDSVATLERVAGGEVLQSYRLDGPLVVIGRDSSCDIVLKGNGVSRRHCMVVLSKDGYCIEDLNSANGTLLNGSKLTEKSPLNDGDKFVVMGHILAFSTADKPVVMPQAANVFTGSPPAMADEDRPPTAKVDPEELSRRLDALLKKNKLSFEDSAPKGE
jgi:pSer/pThr/pTyr-binding forkhead associated (FHA) protein